MSANESVGRPIDSVLVNAVHAVVDGRSAIFADEASQQTVERAYRAATTTKTRRAFEDAIERGTTASAEDSADDEVNRAVGTVVRAVCEELVAQNARVRVDHRTRVEIPPREAVLYTYSRTRDASILDGLSLSEAAAAEVRAGAAHVEDGDYAAATAAFEAAIDASEGQGGSVSTRVLAALASHWNGDDEAAIDLVDEALYFHMDAWTPRLVGYSADHEWPEQFRSGKLAACALFRQTVEVPEDCSAEVALGFPSEDGGGPDIEWQSLDGSDDCMPTDRLASETHVRLRLEGSVPDFPAMLGYHLSLGIVDSEVAEVRDIYRVLLSGPETAESSETITVST